MTDFNDVRHTSNYAKAEAQIRADERARRSPDSEHAKVADWLDDQARIATNSLHCGDNSMTIQRTHDWANRLEAAARHLRTAVQPSSAGISDATCYLNRSDVRVILIEQEAAHILEHVDQLPIFTADDLTSAAQSSAGSATPEPVACRWRNNFTAKVMKDDAWNYSGVILTPNDNLEVEPLYAAPAQSAPQPKVCIKTMRKSDESADYFVSISVGEREVTPHVFVEEYMAAYHVALYRWLLNGADKPDLMAFGPSLSSTDRGGA